MKRIFDIVFSLVVIVFLGWIILLAILISTIESKSWGIFTQERIGKKMRPFRIYKIKSMRNIEGFTSSTTFKKDPRVTVFGGFIRKTKIDELPQIFNVLFGQMSIVGPRPTVKEDADMMNKHQQKRFQVRPGITGLAQINGNTALNWPKRIEYDLYYIDRLSLWFDIKIIWSTFILVVLNKAETHPPLDDEWA